MIFEVIFTAPALANINGQFQQDFSKWTSKNEFIDKFIQEAQLNAIANTILVRNSSHDEKLSFHMHMDEDRLRFFEVNEEMSKMWTFRKLREIIKTDQKESKDVKEKNDKENSQSIDNGLIEYRSMSEKKSLPPDKVIETIDKYRKICWKVIQYQEKPGTTALKKDCQDRGCSSDNQEL
ncbi:hypothetical protein RhiirA4_476284 [Rhizophagus irregularis]|uniref:Uncharacterized protein n=1 Tax=Rhizophagus irregularis TaxID=588596 RepID=A0A2I1HBF1_9GLOM|nr:hypothetical protein RhiirA4_476284 [Rhizophagus irregularis]